ncbi:MAG TPA: hypothetical protein VN958_16110, partial [Chitinophagaceae bacterium]|nr:hypothetical protein [Chitinophagaceae bacterium]
MNNYFLRNRIILFFIFLVSASIFFIATSAIVTGDNNEACAKNILTDSLPHVFNENNGDLISGNLRHEAALRFPLCQLPQSKAGWDKYRVQLKNEIIKKTGTLTHQEL